MSEGNEVFESTIPPADLLAFRYLIFAAEEWVNTRELSQEAIAEYLTLAKQALYGAAMTQGEFGHGGSKWIDRMPDRGHFVYHLVGRKPGADPEEDVQSIYVGVTSNLRARLRAHSRKWWWIAVVEGLCEFDERPTRAIANADEKNMIRWYQPAMNRAGRLLVVESL